MGENTRKGNFFRLYTALTCLSLRNVVFHVLWFRVLQQLLFFCNSVKTDFKQDYYTGYRLQRVRLQRAPG